jgi:hypothetical protein
MKTIILNYNVDICSKIYHINLTKELQRRYMFQTYQHDFEE